MLRLSIPLSSGAISVGVQVEFLHTLALLDEPRPPDGAAPAAEVPELRAARRLFRWDVRARQCCCSVPGDVVLTAHLAQSVGRDTWLRQSLARLLLGNI